MIWLQRLRPWLNALLFLLLLLPLARWGWTLYLPKKAAAAVSAAPLPTLSSKADPVDISAIERTQLFGSNLNNGELPLTTLPLKLQGVIDTGNKADAVAVFAGTDPKLRAVRMGQELQPGVILHQVFKDYAVISNNGRNERVNLDTPPPVLLNSPPPAGDARMSQSTYMQPNANSVNNLPPVGLPMQTPAGQMVIQPAGPGQVMQGQPGLPNYPIPQGVGVPNLPPPYNNHP